MLTGHTIQAVSRDMQITLHIINDWAQMVVKSNSWPMLNSTGLILVTCLHAVSISSTTLRECLWLDELRAWPCNQAKPLQQQGILPLYLCILHCGITHNIRSLLNAIVLKTSCRTSVEQQAVSHSLSVSHSRFLLSCKCGHCKGLLLSITGLARCKAATSFLFSFSRVSLSVNGFRNGTGAFDLTIPSGRTGFLGMPSKSAK